MKKNYILLIAFLITSLTNAQIFITELADPADNTDCRFIELYNSGNASIDLGANNYKIQRFVNDDTTPDITVSLTGSIAAKGFFVIGLAEFNACYGLEPNMIVASNASLFSNGDDKLLLIDGTDSAIDLFGDIGTEGVDTCDDFRDGRAERNANITFGNSGSWMEANWNVSGIGTPTGCTSYTNAEVSTTDMIFDPGAWVGAPVPTNTFVSFVSTSASISEDSGSVDVCISITNPDANTATTVNLNLNGSSSSTNGADYTAISFPVTITFPAGSSANQCITVNITDDTDPETDETMIVNLQNASGGNSAEVGSSSQFTLTILANDLAVNPGDIIITEIFQNPQIVSDSDGEWFEVYNTTSEAIDMDGWGLDDHNSSSIIESARGTTIVPAGGYIVLVKNTDSSTNGGIPIADYDFDDGNFLLSNSNGQIILRSGTIVIDKVAWEGGDGNDGFPVPNGASMQLATDKFDSVSNDIGSNWALATTAYGDGDLGTPGTENNFTLSILKNTIEGFAMYPNPVNNGVFSIKTSLGKSKLVQIYDALGKQVFNQSVENKEEINISNLNAGVYIVRVQEEDKTATNKLIIN